MSRLLAVLVWLLLLAPGVLPAAESEDERLTAFFRRYLDAELKARPLEATRLGDHRFDHLLDDISAKARATWLKRYRDTLDELPRAIAYKKLTREGQIDFEIFQHHLRFLVWQNENTRPFENDPLVYNEYITDSVYLLFTQSTLSKLNNLRNAISRIDSIPRILAVAKAELGKPPQVYAETALRRNKGAIAFYESGIYELAGENPATSVLTPSARKAVAVLKDYQTFLEKTLLPRATGEWRIGKEKFAQKLELELNTGIGAAEVLRNAEAEFARVEREMYVIARQLWWRTHPGKALPPDDEEGRRDTIRSVLAVLGTQHGKPDALVRDARTDVAKIKSFIEKNDILRLPTPDRCKIVEMPEFRRGFSVAYLEPAPPLDPKATSYYAISPPPSHWNTRQVESLLQEYNRYLLQILTIHEAYPGHYVQLEYSNRNRSLVRKVLSSGVFAEGWAVYTEQMMLDQGYGEGDLALRLNQLKFYFRAVGNAILDHRMHCTNLSDEDALTFLTKRAFQAEGEALGKIIRAKLSSCQLSTYFVGRTAFYRLRQAIEREQGAKFQLGRYHEAVLDHGTLPVKYLPELVRERLKKPR